MKTTRTFLATSLVAALMATSALAQTATLVPYTASSDSDISVADVLDMDVYATKNAIDPTNPVSASDLATFDQIGPVQDILMTPEGQMRAIVIGVGGFLGVDRKDIAVESGSVHFVPNSENADSLMLVLNADKAQIDALPEYTKPVVMKTSEATTNEVPPASAASSKTDRAMLRPPSMAHDGYTTVAIGEISADDLQGAAAYGSDDESIGKVDALVLAADGKTVDHIVFDIGGFLGIGVHKVALTPGEVQIMRKDADGDIRVYIDATKSDLEAQPEYNS